MIVLKKECKILVENIANIKDFYIQHMLLRRKRSGGSWFRASPGK
jgi:hypothetical protein